MTLTIPVSIILQSKYPDETPPGMTPISAMSLSSHWLSWTGWMETLLADEDAIRAKLDQSPIPPDADLVVADLEAEIRMNQLWKWPPHARQHFLAAYTRRLRILRDYCQRVGIYVPEVSFQQWRNHRDQHWFAIIAGWAAEGLFADVDVVWRRMYANVQPTDRNWSRERDQMRSSEGWNAVWEAEAGKPLEFVAGLAWTINGGGVELVDPAGLIEQMTWAEQARYDSVHIWSGSEDLGSGETIQTVAGKLKLQGSIG